MLCESDLVAALEHLRALPRVPARPIAWDRKRLIDVVREAIGLRPKVGDGAEVAPGVFALIKPFAVDVRGWDERDRRLQVWLYVRSASTDLARIVEI
jgi:hypothetical protein